MGSANDTALVSEALQMAIKNKPKQQKVLRMVLLKICVVESGVF
jgi:hypothetical protein